jgi:uncharacterized protein (TIGR02246 family)
MKPRSVFWLAAPASLLVGLGVVPAADPPQAGKSQAPAAKAQAPAAKAQAPARAPAGPGAGRAEDASAAHAAIESLAKAFASRDAKALAAHWTSQGEYQNGDVNVRGRSDLEAAFEAFFAKTPEVSATVHSDAVRFLSNDLAIDEGTVTVRRGPTEPTAKADYSALLVREDGKWRLARLSESSEDRTSVADLGWLVGDWKSAAGEGAEIQTTYKWAPNKKFLYVDFTLKEKELALSGRQVIGVDPATGALHSWTFEANGGVGEADWSPDGDHWVLSAEGSLTDGRTLTETNILRRINDDTFTWQSVDRRLDDEALPDLAPVKVVRVKPAK